MHVLPETRLTVSTRRFEKRSSRHAPVAERPIRVLYSFPHRLGAPGIGTIAAAHVRGLVEYGLDVSLYCTSLACEVPAACRVVETMVVRGVRIPHRALGVDRAWRYHDWRVARALARQAAEVDVVHCWPLGSVKTLAAARKLGILSAREVPNTHTEFAHSRAAVEAEAVGLKQVPRAYSHRPNSQRLGRERTEYRLADLLLMPSAYVEQTFLDRGFPPGQLVRHRYGFDPSRFPVRPPGEVRPHQRPLTALFVGYGEPRKGLHYALRAWLDSGAARKGRFIICGGFLPGYRELLAPLLAHSSVQVRGFVQDVAPLMREADILILPSVEEGSALVTYEAQASGCALLVSDAAGAFCRHPDQALVHKAGDLKTLTEHIRLVDLDRTRLADLRATSLSRRDELTWSRATERLATVYATRLQARTTA